MPILTTDEEIRESGRRAASEPDYACPVSAAYIAESDQIAVIFDNGIEVRFPRSSMPLLRDKTAIEVADVTILGDGLRWEAFDIDYSIPNMMDGFAPSCHAAAEFGRRGGAKKSPAKTAAVRANGKKGGRPKKRVHA
jgi:hypothetical protein